MKVWKLPGLYVDEGEQIFWPDFMLQVSSDSEATKKSTYATLTYG